jgi:hypothetical protein
VGEDHKEDAGSPIWQSLPEEKVAKYVPVAAHEGNLHPACPPSRPQVLGTRRNKMGQRKKVEVEAGEEHDGVVQPFLESDHKVGGAVPYELKSVVICALDRFEVSGSGGEEGDVLEIGVVFLAKLARRKNLL